MVDLSGARGSHEAKTVTRQGEKRREMAERVMWKAVRRKVQRDETETSRRRRKVVTDLPASGNPLRPQQAGRPAVYRLLHIFRTTLGSCQTLRGEPTGKQSGKENVAG